MYLGLLVALLIALILLHSVDMAKYTERVGIDLTSGAKHKDTTGFIRHMPADSAPACQTACDSAEWCSAYTYTGDACYGVAGREETPAAGYISGYKPNYKIDFAAKLRKTESLALSIPAPEDGAAAAAMVRAPRSRGLSDGANRVSSREFMSSGLSARDQRIKSSAPEFMSVRGLGARDQRIISGVK